MYKLESVIKFLIAASFLLGLATTASADIYTWVDAEGVHHFSSEPPRDGSIRAKVFIEEAAYARSPDPVEADPADAVSSVTTQADTPRRPVPETVVATRSDDGDALRPVGHSDRSYPSQSPDTADYSADGESPDYVPTDYASQAPYASQGLYAPYTASTVIAKKRHHRSSHRSLHKHKHRHKVYRRHYYAPYGHTRYGRHYNSHRPGKHLPRIHRHKKYSHDAYGKAYRHNAYGRAYRHNPYGKAYRHGYRHDHRSFRHGAGHDKGFRSRHEHTYKRGRSSHTVRHRVLPTLPRDGKRVSGAHNGGNSRHRFKHHRNRRG